MKQIITLIIAVFFGTLASYQAQADPVGKKDAARVALTWLSMKGGAKAAGLKVELVQAMGQNNALLLVRFQGGGFVLVSGDDKAQPIIAYSTESSFPVGKLPAEVAEWLAAYDQQVHMAGMLKSATPEIDAQWGALRSGKLPKGASYTEGSYLLTCIWDQGCQYNDFCPVDYSSGYCNRVPVGCAATAMAQIMYYHKYPDQGQDSISYQSDYGTLSVNFSAQTYDWSSMKDYLTSSIADNESEVAKLSYHCGVAVKMQYAPDGSGTAHLYVGPALNKYFNYEYNGYSRSDYTDQEWTDLLKEEIGFSNPILYSGYGDYGHAFVCDGYDGDYFHFNWGWEGSYNGFYLLDNMYVGGNDFNEGHEVFFLQPDTLEVYLSNPIINDTRLYFGNEYEYSFDLANKGVSWSGDAYLNLYDQSSKYVKTIGKAEGLSLDSGETYSAVYADTISDLSIGIYYLRAEISNNGKLSKVDKGLGANPLQVEIKLHKPSAITASRNMNKKVKLSWSKVPGASYYRVYRSTDANPYWSDEISGWISDTFFTDESIADNYQEYNYWVRASSNAQGDNPSAYSSMATGMGILTAPGIEISAKTDNSISLKWDSDETTKTIYYQLMRSQTEDEDNADIVLNWQADRTSYTDINVSQNQMYYYWMRAAYDTVNQVSSYSDAITAWLKITPPSKIMATKGDYKTYVKINWNAVSPGFFYKVYRSTQAQHVYASPVTSWMKDTCIYDSATYEGVYYYYWVKTATDEEGNFVSELSLADTGYVEGTVSLKEHRNPQNIRVYPSPADETLFVEAPGEDAEGTVNISIRDLSGREVIHLPMKQNGQAIMIDVSKLQAGVYILSAAWGRLVQTKRILIY